MITGATGFIGSHLARTLVASSARVWGLSRNESDFTGVQNLICDITNRDRLNEIIAEVRPSHIFHLAANKARSAKTSDFRQCIDENLIGTLNLLEACEAISCKPRFVSLGTCEEYGGAIPPYFEAIREVPVSAYSCSKVAMTQFLLAYN
mgnify:FL=1